MGLFGWFWRRIKAGLIRGLENGDDPMFDQLRRELEELKEQAIQAMQARNQLRIDLQERESRLADLNARVVARRRGEDEEAVRSLLAEIEACNSQMAEIQPRLRLAEQEADTAKAAIEVAEARVRAELEERLRRISGK